MRRLLTLTCATVLVAGCGTGPPATTSPVATSSGVTAASGITPAPASASESRAPTASPPVSAAPPAPAEPSIDPSPAPSASRPPPTSSAATAPASSGPTAAVRWRRSVATGPSAREDQTWTVDGDGRYAYLYGGRAGGDVFGDLWRFDLVNDAWKLLAPLDGPKPRFGHTATWVPGVGLVVFSGQAGGAFFNDLWAYSPGTNAWRHLASTGSVPEPRYGSCAGLAPDGRLWISHGFTDQGRYFDTRAYDFTKRAWADISRTDPVPVIRCLHDCIWTPDGRFVLYGGQTNGVAALGDLWVRPERGDWQPQPQPPLEPRQLYAVTTTGATAWIFGGANRDHAPLRDLWTLDLSDFSWREVSLTGSIPPARLSATLIADPARSRLLLFGGKSNQTTYDDLWELRLGP